MSTCAHTYTHTYKMRSAIVTDRCNIRRRKKASDLNPNTHQQSQSLMTLWDTPVQGPLVNELGQVQKH